ncbi:uncharacterized protein LOC143284485 [Babylonia areolata]|uniref:uncharacterized protein LOC143284485 n=1 Tax=Babylonia areolata TaxID=304850 RepID=UPI003FD44DBC
MFATMTDALLLAAAVLLLTSQGQSYKCDVREKQCDIWLVIEHGLTMMKEKSLTVVQDGLLFAYNEPNRTIENTVSPDTVVTADGWLEPRLITTVNGTIPGPLIEVHEGQVVRIHLRNALLAETTSLHFHGQLQRDTPYADGVAFVSQCPVLPGQTFVHQFKANPVGTFWYHSHSGGQTGMGMYGGFIVHPRREAAPTAAHDKEFTLLFQDWNHDWDTTVGYLKMMTGMYVHGQKDPQYGGLSGVKYSAFRIQSVLINGRGRYRVNETAPDNGAPLSTFTVTQGGVYRFRLIHAGSVYPFQVSVDGHRLKVIAADGMKLKDPVMADSVILTPGERYDFELVANQSVKNYWIRATTLEVRTQHVGRAILNYEGGEPADQDPVTDGRQCTEHEPCVVVNCPFLHFADQDSHQCYNVEQLRAAEKMPHHVGRGAHNVKEYFLNFAFPGTTFTPASVNGVQMELPHVSALAQPLEFNTRCPGEGYRCADDEVCRCTAVLDLQKDEVAQLVLTNLGVGQGWDHPVHMHGHSFWVLKVGYPNYDNHTGNFVSDNLDVDCRGNPDRSLSFCNNATWSNASWSGNGVDGLELDHPVLKDTVNVPTGGYVVIRIQADNPGVWPVHCHVSLHLEDGMFLLLNESYPHHRQPPPGFRQCGDFIF